MISDSAKQAFISLTNSSRGILPCVKKFSKFNYMLNIHYPSGETPSVDSTGVVDCNQYSCAKLYSGRISNEMVVTTYIHFSDDTSALIAQHAISHFFEHLFNYNVKTYAYNGIVYFSFPIKLLNGHWYMHNFLLKYLRLGLAYCIARGATDIPPLPKFGIRCYEHFGSIMKSSDNNTRRLYEFFQHSDDGEQFLRLHDRYNYLMSIPFEKWTFNDMVFGLDDSMRASFMNYLEKEDTSFHKQYKKHASTIAASKP